MIPAKIITYRINYLHLRWLGVVAGILISVFNLQCLYGIENILKGREHIFVSTDRDVYISGESILFNAWLMPPNTIKNDVSRFVYLIFRNTHSNISEYTVKLEENMASGVVYIPDSLSSGIYEIIAYTNSMRATGESHFFRKPVFVANRFDSQLMALNPPQPIISTEQDVSIFPEGGAYFCGLANNLLLKFDDPTHLAGEKVIITSEYGDTLASGRINEYGFAGLKITDTASDSLYVHAGTNNVIRKYFPCTTCGYGISVNIAGTALDVDIRKCAAGIMNTILLLKKGNEIVKRIFLAGNINPYDSLRIDHTELPSGLLVFQLLDEMNNTLAQRYWYNDSRLKDHLIVNHTTVAGKRQLAKLNIDLPLDSEFSPEVLLMNFSVSQKGSSFDNTFTIERYKRALDVRDNYNKMSPAEFSLIASLELNELNQYLIGLGREQVEYHQDVLTDYLSSGAFLKENKEVIISGKVTDSESGLPVHHARVIMCTPDTIISLAYSMTDEKGEFSFLLFPGYYNRELFLSVDPQSYSGNNRIQVYDKFEVDNSSLPGRIPVNKIPAEMVAKNQEIVKVQKVYRLDYFNPGEVVNPDPSAMSVLFSKSDLIIRPGDYFALDNLHEIARELIPPLQIRRSQRSYSGRLFCARTHNPLPGNPVYFVDGIMTYELDPLIDLNSDQIKEIQIHNRSWVYGNMFFPGIVGIFTQNEEFRKLDLHGKAHVWRFDSFVNHPVYNTPVYTDQQIERRGLPDMRQVLFWKPGVRLKKGESLELEFYTGDLAGDYIITIQGLGSNGEVFYLTRNLTVK